MSRFDKISKIVDIVESSSKGFDTFELFSKEVEKAKEDFKSNIVEKTTKNEKRFS